MAQNLVVNGVSFLCPQQGDQNWAGANQADGWMAAVTVGMLQKAGGAFTLTADVNFGSSFGLISRYLKSVSANIAGSGALRLANTDSIGWRNAGNSADQVLLPHADGILQYAGVDLVNLSATQTLTNKSLDGGSNTVTGLTNAAIAAGAAIAYSKLNLTGSVVNADIASAAAIALSKLATQANNTILGNVSGSSAVPVALTAAQVNTLLGSLSNPMTTLGDLISGGASGAATRLAGDTSNTRKFLRTLSSAGTAAAPAWDTIQQADVPYKAPTVQKFTSGSGTYTTPTSPSPLYLEVIAVGGGGGGAGSSTSAGNGGSGGSGGNTTFGTTLIVASGGGGASGGNNGYGTGGTASLGTGPLGIALAGGNGGPSMNMSGSTGVFASGGQGGTSALGGAGNGGVNAASGNVGVANSGSGGGGAGSPANGISGGGGGAGGFVRSIITSPASTYAYAVGAAGTAGASGTSGFAGSAAGSGFLVIMEHYQ